MNFQEFKKQYEKKKVVEYPNDVVGNPVVSVCIMAYRHVAFIKQCLEGILMQQVEFPLEILLGEDASDDGSREICLEYAEKYPNKIRLFLHHRENNIRINGAPSGRFNFLYNLYSSRGKYVALCEGDDYWTDPHKLQKQFDILEKKTSFSFCFHPVDVSNEIVGIRYSYPLPRKQVLHFSDILCKHYIPTCSVFFRREFFPCSIPLFFIHCPMADLPLEYVLASKGAVYCFKEKMGVYRKNLGGITVSKNQITNGRKGYVLLYKEVRKFVFPKVFFILSFLLLKTRLGYVKSLLGK